MSCMRRFSVDIETKGKSRKSLLFATSCQKTVNIPERNKNMFASPKQDSVSLLNH